ncbi:MAG TPA: DUF302 domain-containing protein [Acidimicrobiales bacterium]|jgi:uncharacterized protein (DUF302 family)
MNQQSSAAQPGAGDGIITKASPHRVGDTLARLQGLLKAKNLALFAVVDHSGEAERVGQHMPDTKLVIFGSPAAGTPVMVASPLSALDLPLKILIREDDRGATSVSYNAPAYLAARHHLTDELTARVAAVGDIADAITAP